MVAYYSRISDVSSDVCSSDLMLGDRQPEPGSAVAARGGAVALAELFEHGGLQGLGQADIGVVDLDAQARAVALDKRYPRLDDDLRGEIHGVADQVAPTSVESGTSGSGSVDHWGTRTYK